MAETKKFSPMRFTAATEAAAVEGALNLVGVSRDDVEYEVLDESAKGVTVRIKPRSSDASHPAPAAPVYAESEPSPIAETVPELMAQDESAPDDADEYEAAADEIEEAEADDVDEDVENGVEDDLPTDEDEAEMEDDIAGESGDFDSQYESDDEEVEAEPAVPVDPAIVERAQNKAQEFLEKMGLEASAQMGRTSDANTVALIIEGPDVGILIGKHGGTLQSFQYLLNLTLNARIEGDGTRVVVDAGNYRARRQSSLEQTARSAASKARRDGRSVRLDPMPAHERRLVHMFLQTESDIATQSEGREPMRRIVVSPAGMRPSTPRSSERPLTNDRPFGDRRNNSGGSGMGGYGRRGNSNGGGNSGGNRGFNRGR